MYAGLSGKSKKMGSTVPGSKSKVAIEMMNDRKKLALAGKGVKKSGKWHASWSPLSIDQSWFSEAAKIRLTMKLPAPAAAAVVSAVPPAP